MDESKIGAIIDEVTSSFFESLEQDIESERDKSPIRLELMVTSEPFESGYEQSVYMRLLHVGDEIISRVESYQDILLGNIRQFSGNVAPTDQINATQTNGGRFKASALEVIKVVKTMIGYIRNYEGLKMVNGRNATVRVFNTDYFNQFNFSQSRFPKAPAKYHTNDEEVSKVWADAFEASDNN